MKNNLKLYNEWISNAQDDIFTAEILLEESGPNRTICFHCQQAIEKYLKAFLSYYRIHFEKIHDLWKLAKLCAKKDKEFLNWEKELKTLDAYYIEARYPPNTEEYSKEEAEKSLEITHKIIDFISNKIK